MKPKTRMLVSSVAAMLGLIIGAGFLGVPKAMTISGTLAGILLMVAVGVAMTFMCLFTTELTLNTKKVYQMPGIIGKYLGKKAGMLSAALFSLISFGAMSAYLTASSDIISHYTGFSTTISMAAYFLVLFFFVWKGLKLIEKAEIYLTMGKILFLAALLFVLSPQVSTENLANFPTTNLLVPLGVFLFSFGGYNGMTQVEQLTNGDKNLMVKTSILSSVIPFIFYALFGLLIVGVFGTGVKEIATENLSGVLGIIGNALALVAMTGACIMSGLLWKDMLIDDYGMKNGISTIISMGLPFLFTMIVSPSFINTLAFTGSVLSGLFAILVCAAVVIHRKKIRKSYYKVPGGSVVPVLVSIFFLIGMMVLFVQ